ncbi:ribosomal-protein-alanine N-acetyltransferase [Fontibacillus phaseoli]|uniref:Ribosomal-protein-alanine N-acetyltransferase n=1 Tax=Fontibacillus phaseoli TaxID=1416533 RepID=A0A369BGY1_9BACL|nr:GNAT family N-acetyltransferase [Fontibacillus phaseoli]RCX19737.1 ribosomal-protein-alanine N-acetyltransferase [Fontibacillus phaseoli]
MKPILHSERLILKVLDGSNAVEVLEFVLRNKEFLEPWEPVRSEEYFTLSYQEDLLVKEFSQFRKRELYKLWMFRKEEPEKVIGSITLSNIVYGAFQSCHLGYRIDQSAQGRGLMTEAVAAVADYAFSELGLHRIEANIMPRNKASLKVAEKAGFYHEGLALRYLKINGVWEDHFHMVLRNERIE